MNDIGSPYRLTITLNVNGSNFSVKRHRVPEWIWKETSYRLPTRESLELSGHTQAQSQGTEKDSTQLQTQGVWQVAVLTSDRL